MVELFEAYDAAVFGGPLAGVGEAVAEEGADELELQVGGDAQESGELLLEVGLDGGVGDHDQGGREEGVEDSQAGAEFAGELGGEILNAGAAGLFDAWHKSPQV